MVSKSEEWSTFIIYLKNIKILQESFFSSEIIHLPRTHNLKTDNLVQNIKKQPIFVTHMNVELSVCFTEYKFCSQIRCRFSQL